MSDGVLFGTGIFTFGTGSGYTVCKGCISRTCHGHIDTPNKGRNMDKIEMA